MQALWKAFCSKHKFSLSIKQLLHGLLTYILVHKKNFTHPVVMILINEFFSLKKMLFQAHLSKKYA